MMMKNEDFASPFILRSAEIAAAELWLGLICKTQDNTAKSNRKNKVKQLCKSDL